MKKISVILGALALGCVAMLTSCKNGAQDVNVVNWDDALDAGDYVCDVSDVVVTGSGLPTGITFSVASGVIRWQTTSSNTNYTDYTLEVKGFKYKVGAEENTMSDVWYTIRKIGSTYSVPDDDDVESVTVDPSFESSTFTAKITYKKGEGPMGADSVSMKFTRK